MGLLAAQDYAQLFQKEYDTLSHLIMVDSAQLFPWSTFHKWNPFY